MRPRRPREFQADLPFGGPVAGEPAGQRVYSVTELTAEVKELLETAHPAVYVRGEISNFLHHTSGHMYMALKDAGAQIKAAFFRGANRGIKFDPENGMEVIAFGRLSVYEPRGEYQIIVEHLEPAGVGALQARIEKLKKKLEAEGLFSPARKRPLPDMPRTIAVVTSPEGAAVKDFLKVTRMRFPGQHIVIFPAIVQGEAAPAAIVAGIADANAMGGFDVLVVCRGGGSLEDLMAFNEESVARAIAASAIPVVCGVGHERDVSIADLVADVRAATPSQAAEIVTPSRTDLLRRLIELEERMERLVRGLVEEAMQLVDDTAEELADTVAMRLKDLAGDLRDLASRVRSRAPLEVLSRQRQLVEQLVARSITGVLRRADRAKQQMAALGEKLNVLSPLAVLDRGYAIAFALPGRTVVRDAATVVAGTELEIKLARGRVRATARSSTPGEER